MKKRFPAIVLALALCLGLSVPAFAADHTPAASEVYQAITAMKEQYPEGTPWTNSNSYSWKGGIYSTGYGCAGFAFMLSDAAFGNLPARMLTQFTFSDVGVGDILRLDNNSHSVIVLEVHDSYVVIAEGNYNSAVHWGRQLSAAEVLTAEYMITRYPVGASKTEEPKPDAPSFTDVTAGAWYADAVTWAVEEGITNGTTTTTFSPNQDCTRVQILTFLWRAAGEPGSDAKLPIDITGKNIAYAESALRWAAALGLIDGSFDTGAMCTRADAVNYIWRVFDRPGAEPASFTDVDAGASYAAAVNWAVENGVTNGKTATTFAPDEVCTRGHIVTFLHRAYVEEARLTVD